MADDALSARDDTPGNTRTSSATASERSDDAPDCVPSKWVSDVQALLRKTRLRLLVRRVSTSGEFSRFVQLKKEVLTLLTIYLHAHFGECSGISFVDSTRLRVCDNKRISSHRVFAERAGRSKTSMGWFYGFKLHLMISEKGDLLGVELTPGNTDDRQPLWELSSERLFGNLYGDKGYISKDLREFLNEQGINFCYKVRKNMKPLPLSIADEVLLKKRTIIESVIKELKTQTQVEHSRHRSFVNFQVNVISALIAYQFLESKPSVNLSELQASNDLPVLF